MPPIIANSSAVVKPSPEPFTLSTAEVRESVNALRQRRQKEQAEYVEELVTAYFAYQWAGLRMAISEGKNPGGILGEEWQLKPPITDESELRELLLKANNPSIGFITSPQSGVLDFDVDGDDEAEALADLFGGKEHVPNMPTYSSGRDGGLHRLAMLPEEFQHLDAATITYTAASGKSIVVRIGCKLQADGDGSGAYSVLPPSRHCVKDDRNLYTPTGKTYTWLTDLQQVRPPALPQFVVQRLLEAHAKRPHTDGSREVEYDLANIGAGSVSRPALADMVRRCDGIHDKGDGSSRLIAAACRCVEHDLTPADSVATIRAYERHKPFRRDYSDDGIIKRLKDAEAKAVRGSALIAPQYELTDAGNALRFAREYGDKFRWVEDWKLWLAWDGSRWSATSAKTRTMQAAKSVASGIYKEAAELQGDRHRQDDTGAWAKTSQSRQRLEAMIALAQSEEPFPVASESLDCEAELLNCANGTVDLRTGELLPHDPGNMLTKTTGVEYPDEPGVDAELWQGFLLKIFDGNEGLIEYVQRLMGAALVGQQVEHKLPIFYGSGANGKSVFTSTMLAALGDYGLQAPQGLFMSRRKESHPTERAALHGKRFVVISETREGQSLDEAMVKSLTGNERITARRMHEDFWSFEPTHLPVLVTNHKPRVSGTDNGIWRRLQLVPFEVTIPESEQDKQLPEKLKAELGAILRWAVEGCLAWRRDNFDLKAPQEVQAATSEYRRESDTFERWASEMLVEDADGEVRGKEAYEHYQHWADDNGEAAVSKRAFCNRLRKLASATRVSNGTLYQGWAWR